MTVALIVAVSSNGVIGRDGDLPWRLPADLRHFKSTTMGHHLIIGRATWDEVGRPLPGRTMVVVTRNQGFAADGVLVAHSLEAALELAKDDAEPFVGGGAEIYRLALDADLVERIYLTRVHAEVEGDTVFPEVPWDRWLLADRIDHPADEKNPYPYTFEVWDRSRY
ncbi:MAG: dihydrofolate reductase [Thermoanaerobaculales bacterium]|jgi:dihydrofolate reductase|nr:dihydrofolate reductase [Thermoanaerobaculales bacterium]